MQDEGFLDFSMGMDDEGVKKKAKSYKAKDGEADRVSFAWFSVRKEDEEGNKYWDDDAAWDDDGNLTENAVVRFTGCRRIYIKGVGQVLYKNRSYMKYGKPKQCIGTIIVVWSTDSDGDLDADKVKKGKGWVVQPWVHNDPEKYENLKKINKRYPLMKQDILFSCPENGAEYQKITFTPEPQNLLQEMLNSDKPEARAVADKIIAEVKALASTMNDEMATAYTHDEIAEKLSGDSESPTGESKHAAKDVDGLLEGMV